MILFYSSSWGSQYTLKKQIEKKKEKKSETIIWEQFQLEAFEDTMLDHTDW